MARGLLELLAAEDRDQLRDALPASAATLVDASLVLLVAQEAAGARLVASHGLDSVPGFDPARERPAGLPNELTLPVPVPTTPPLAISCHRAEPFAAEAREALDQLLLAVGERWNRMVARETEEAAAQAQARQLDQKLRQLTERMARNDRMKAEFLATMSHELRTPLNVVLGFSSLLADRAFGELNKEQDEACQKILESSERLAILINDLLDVSRLDSGTLQFHFAATDLCEMVRGEVKDKEPIARQRDISLQIELPAGACEAEADEGRLRQVVAHLLDNALKFTEPGGRVGVRLMTDNPDQVSIEVWDSGIGIPETARHRLFERFFQVDSSNTRLYGGTGIGLALVKEFVERHGGRVSVDSQVGRGSTFRLDLPRVASNNASVLFD
ncbi:MAG: multi-sensor hybrid histidine kinase [Cyanobacteria bacterium RYN_339]|nr:multi-sensor hybrid histidine kinase [Cyanobacteria bacterium RYN_339]